MAIKVPVDFDANGAGLENELTSSLKSATRGAGKAGEQAGSAFGSGAARSARKVAGALRHPLGHHEVFDLPARPKQSGEDRLAHAAAADDRDSGHGQTLAGRRCVPPGGTRAGATERAPGPAGGSAR